MLHLQPLKYRSSNIGATIDLTVHVYLVTLCSRPPPVPIACFEVIMHVYNSVWDDVISICLMFNHFTDLLSYSHAILIWSGRFEWPSLPDCFFQFKGIFGGFLWQSYCAGVRSLKTQRLRVRIPPEAFYFLFPKF